VLLAFAGFSQENLITLSGGYSFANLDPDEFLSEDASIKANGWRINFLYEFNAREGNWAYGSAIGYVSISATDDSDLDTAEYKVSTVPVYFAPKYMFGSDKVKGFVKGALGFHSAWMERTGEASSIEGRDWGFYGGAGAGLMFYFNEMIFLNGEYEFAFLSNSYYNDGFLHSIMLGIGVKF
jgi:hypothetical protein